MSPGSFPKRKGSLLPKYRKAPTSRRSAPKKRRERPSSRKGSMTSFYPKRQSSPQSKPSYHWRIHLEFPPNRYYEIHEKRSEEHTSELQSRFDLVCRLLLEKKKKKYRQICHLIIN